MSANLKYGGSIPLVSFGTGTSLFSKSAYDGTLQALKSGVRHIDTAQIYKNEDSVGQAITDSGVPREQLFITTKYGGGGSVREQFEASLKKLQVSYIDLYLIHWPGVTEQSGGIAATWADFEKLKSEGLARHIGVSNFDNDDLNKLISTAKEHPEANQIELSPTTFKKVEGIYKYNTELGIVVEAYGALSSLSHKKADFDKLLNNLASKYSVSTGAVILLWLKKLGIVAVTTTSKQERFDEYKKVYSDEVTLSDEDIQSVTNIGKQYLEIKFPEHLQNI